MKGPEESYTVIIFRGARANPLRLKIRKTIVRNVVIGGICLLLVQFGVLTHYFFQRSQLNELDGIRSELSTSRERTSTFAGEVDGMKKRMVSLERLNRKLQTMFGLESDEIEGLQESIPGQGGEEIPFESSSREIDGGTLHQDDPDEKDGGTSHRTADQQISAVASGLTWLKSHAKVEKKILDHLAMTVNKRAKRWASTPSIWPVKGHITSRFGPRVSPFTGKKALHAGLDIGAPRGTPVYAPASGKVVVAAYDARMGKFVRIDHGFGIETTYGHLSKIHVKYGMKVNRGDPIGLVGSTGKFSTGPHLHYQVAVNDRVVNPVQYILD